MTANTHGCCCRLEYVGNRSEVGLELIQSGLRVRVEDRSAVDGKLQAFYGAR